MGIDRQIMRGSLDLMVLSTLRDQAKYGYLIQKHIREASAGKVRLPGGTLYPLLHRLEQAGAIRGRRRTEGGVSRRWYELTAAGKRMLSAGALEWQRASGVLDVLLGGEQGLATDV